MGDRDAKRQRGARRPRAQSDDMDDLLGAAGVDARDDGREDDDDRGRAIDGDDDDDDDGTRDARERRSRLAGLRRRRVRAGDAGERRRGGARDAYARVSAELGVVESRAQMLVYDNYGKFIQVMRKSARRAMRGTDGWLGGDRRRARRARCERRARRCGRDATRCGRARCGRKR